MSYYHKYQKYKQKYLNYKKSELRGGVITSQDIINSLKDMSLPDLINLDLESVNREIKTMITVSYRLSPDNLTKLEIIENIGQGAFGETKKMRVSNDIVKDNQTILPKDSIILGKYIKVSRENPLDALQQMENEIIAYTNISLANCGLPKLYGYFESVPLANQTDYYYLILIDFISGKNMFNEIIDTKMRLDNNDDIQKLFIWINQIEQTLNCLHQYNITHRDVKLDNVIIRSNEDRSQDAVLVDYGLTCKFLTFCSKKYYRTYTSPLKYEMMKSDTSTLEVEKKNDIYSLGILSLDALSLMYSNTTIGKATLNDLFNIKLQESLCPSYKPDKLKEINSFIDKLQSEYKLSSDFKSQILMYINKGLPAQQIVISTEKVSTSPGLDDGYSTLKGSNEYSSYMSQS